MSGTTDSSRDVGLPVTASRGVPGGRPPGPAPQSEALRTPSPAAPSRAGRNLAWLAPAGIISSVLIMIAASVIRNSWEIPRLILPATGPPWGVAPHVPLTVVSTALWLAALAGGGGVIAGLAALRRGARLPVRLPPAGSTDAIDYAVYGRIAVLHHSPYVMTPNQLRRTGDPVGRAAPIIWGRHVTVYGPLATAEQYLSAELGGTSAARIIFWLKLWNAIAFGAVALALDRMLRSSPARRIRAHLLWTANPLLLWGLIATGHLDVVAAAAGLFGLLVLRQRAPDGPAAVQPTALQGLAAGLLVGVAADIKISFLLFAVGIAWACRKSAAAWLSAAAGGAIVLVPSYLWSGSPAARALLDKSAKISVDSFYQIFVGSHGNTIPYQLPVAGLLFVAVAVLMLLRLPDGTPALPAVQPALAVTLAWLFIWPYQLPWYDSMVVGLIVLYPASRLDWLVLARLIAPTFALMPGNAGLPPQHVLALITNDSLFWWAPAVLLAAAVALVWLAVTGAWKMDPPLLTRTSEAPQLV
jgi:alpha-1,6-mannosyltransferase